MAKYRKKPVVIEGVQWTGRNVKEISEFMCGGRSYWFSGKDLMIETLEGNHRANIGDFIIKGVEKEFYPCKPDIFRKTYEAVK